MWAKKVFHPSDNNLPKKRARLGVSRVSLCSSTIEKQLAELHDIYSRPESRSSVGSLEQGGICSVCYNNKKVRNDRLVACRQCSEIAHVSCLNGEGMMLKMYLGNTWKWYPDNTWECSHCKFCCRKTCCICYEASDIGFLTVCSVCADAYHAGCHVPQITEKIKGGTKWLCINCQMPEQLQVAEIHPNVSSGDVFTHRDTGEDGRDKESSPGSSMSDDSNRNSLPPSPTPPTLSPQASHIGATSAAASPEIKCSISDSQSIKDLDVDDLIDPSIPDATHWTSKDVYNYFAQYFPEEAKVFREQEIDGRSLLLMKRMDFLFGLKFKFGPALKIYRHVVKLQLRRDDPKLYWLQN